MSPGLEDRRVSGRVFDGHWQDRHSARRTELEVESRLKLYKCEVECDFHDAVIRPGMSCEVELIKESYDKTLYVPCVVVAGRRRFPACTCANGEDWGRTRGPRRPGQQPDDQDHRRRPLRAKR
jgi:hypothetical protein